jgi:hypothetical protein
LEREREGGREGERKGYIDRQTRKTNRNDRERKQDRDTGTRDTYRERKQRGMSERQTYKQNRQTDRQKDEQDRERKRET